MISSDIGTKIVSFITMFGEELVMIAVLGFLYWCYDKKFGRFVGTNILVGLVVNPMLKKKNKVLLESATMLAYLIRTVRYAIIIFILIGVYPLIFD